MKIDTEIDYKGKRVEPNGSCLAPIHLFPDKNNPCFEIQYTDDEIAVFDALKNTYSFVIKGNELIIHFTKAENRNLLILKKR